MGDRMSIEIYVPEIYQYFSEKEFREYHSNKSLPPHLTDETLLELRAFRIQDSKIPYISQDEELYRVGVGVHQNLKGEWVKSWGVRKKN